jgi:predicted RNA-binding protein
MLDILEGLGKNMFEDSDQAFKKTFNATSNEEILTVTEAGQMLGLSKDQMKLFVDKKGLTKIKVARSVFRYLLLKEEIDNLLNKP